MKFFGKTLGLLLASLALASCGGGGGDGGSFTSPQSGTITLAATTTTLPLNTSFELPSAHGPSQAEVTITLRNADGTLMVGSDVQVSISPVNVAAISVLDDGEAEVDDLWGTYPIEGTNGVATAWVNSRQTAGTAVFTASTLDPNTDRTISATMTFTVTSGVGNAPASVELSPSRPNVYLPSSGGNNTTTITAIVRDGGNQFVPDPASGNGGVDNVRFELVGDFGDARLSTNSVAGPVSGSTVNSHTVRGVATASFQAGEATPQGPYEIRATADRADNNVTNGIQDPVTSTTSIIVSDGKLYSLTITSPNVNAILVNTVSGEVDPEGDIIPPDPDATYSLTVSALATDRQGNPVIPGTPIRFGSIDEPVGTFDAGPLANRFLISGGDGNPQEGGTLFTAPTGHFRTAGGGAGPGDALVVFGKTQHGAPEGNEDLESAVTIQRVNSETSLNTASRFNNNNTTGAIVDYGPVLDYVIGRSQHGNITAASTTNEIGVAHATLNYTIETLGHVLAMWAQGDGIDRVTGEPRRVTDAVQLLYPGVAPAMITAFPSPIPGNTATEVVVCLTDALSAPIQGINIGFQMNLNGGTGSIDGNGASGVLDNVTGPDGCTVASVVTNGMPVSSGPDSPSGSIVFGVGGATAEVDIVVQLAFISNGGVGGVCAGGAPSARATIRAFTTDGSPASGVEISAECTGVQVSPSTATTGSSGSATFTITGEANATGSCTFTAAGVAPITLAVQVPGADDFSPPCGDGP